MKTSNGICGENKEVSTKESQIGKKMRKNGHSTGEKWAKGPCGFL